MVKGTGRSLDDIFKGGMSIGEFRTALRGLGANFTEVQTGFVKTWQQLVQHASQTEGVVAVSISGIRNGKAVGHRILVGRSGGSARIFDRYGVFASLDDLSRYYNVNFQLSNAPLFVVRNWALDAALAKKLDLLGPLGAVVVRGFAMLTLNPAIPASRMQADLDRLRTDHDAGPLPPNPSPGPPPASDVMAMHYVPAAGAMLSKVSMSYYGTYHMWPLIWDGNREVIGDNPNRVPAEIYLRIMKRHVYTKTQIDAARRRSLNWKAFN